MLKRALHSIQTENIGKLIKKRFIFDSSRELINKAITIGISYGVCLRKKCFVSCGGFNEKFTVGEDTELILNFITKKYRLQHIPIFGVIKDESNSEVLSKKLSKYAESHVVRKLLLQYYDFFAKDISLYCAFIQRGNFIYKNQKMYITDFFFTLFFFLKHNKKVKVLKELLCWRLKC